MTQIEQRFSEQYPNEPMEGIITRARTMREALGERGPCDLFLIDEPAGYVVRARGQVAGEFVGIDATGQEPHP